MLGQQKILELCGTGDAELGSSIAQVLLLSGSRCLCEPQLSSREVGICTGLQGGHYKLQQLPRPLKVCVMTEIIGRTDNCGL